MEVLPNAAPQTILIGGPANVGDVGLATKPGLNTREPHRIDAVASRKVAKELPLCLDRKRPPRLETAPGEITRFHRASLPIAAESGERPRGPSNDSAHLPA